MYRILTEQIFDQSQLYQLCSATSLGLEDLSCENPFLMEASKLAYTPQSRTRMIDSVVQMVTAKSDATHEVQKKFHT